MKTSKFLLLTLCLSVLCLPAACAQKKPESIVEPSKNTAMKNPYYSQTSPEKLNISDAEWKKVLPLDLYLVSREADTERAFTGKFWNTDIKGTYYCAACGNLLFRSGAKFQSELDHVMIGYYHGEPIINPDEVESWKWLSIDAIHDSIAASPEEYTVWFKIIFEEFYHYLEDHKL